MYGCTLVFAAESLLSTTANPEAAFRTPYKYGKLILSPSEDATDFDSKGVDCAFVFSANDRFYMTYIGYDGTGYQTGLAESHDLIHWEKKGLIFPRDPLSKYRKYNSALTSILRDDDLQSTATLKKVGGQYLATWHAYPNAGYEEGAAVIGLASSRDLIHWVAWEPILLEGPHTPTWERGGLYKSYLVKDGSAYYLFYNAKNHTEWPWTEQIGVATSTDLKIWRRYPGNPIVAVGPSGSVDDTFASDPFVVRYGRQWALYFYSLSSTDNRARDLLALGMDPFHVSKVNEIMVDVGAPGNIDDRYAHKPAVISWEGALYHFYTAASGAGDGPTDGHESDVRGIAVARSRPW
jgi:hypothetical protein